MKSRIPGCQIRPHSGRLKTDTVEVPTRQNNEGLSSKKVEPGSAFVRLQHVVIRHQNAAVANPIHASAYLEVQWPLLCSVIDDTVSLMIDVTK